MTAGHGAVIALALLLALALPAHAEDAAAGIGLGLFATDPDFNYGALIEEIEEAGAEHVLLVVPWYQKNVRSTVIRPLPGRSPSIETVRRTLHQLKTAGIGATVMPIVLLEVQEHARQWRGVITPERHGVDGTARWFASYRDFVVAHAVLAGEVGAERFIVGSELLSMEDRRELWLELIHRVRAVFDGPLVYSANWDQFDEVSFWDALDGIGVNGYFRLAPDGVRPTEDALVDAWARPLADLAELRDKVGLPLLITEVGYSSRSTAAAKPWCACAAEPIDQELQATLYRALFRVFADRELERRGEAPLPFGQYFVWNWFGFGGPEDGTFTPRGKPAERVLRDALSR